MKQIGAEIGVNESRVSQLHARAIRRLRDALGQLVQQVVEMRRALGKPKILKARSAAGAPQKPAVPSVTPTRAKRPVAARAMLKMDRPRRAMAASR
jgi:hypothetical protein